MAGSPEFTTSCLWVRLDFQLSFTQPPTLKTSYLWFELASLLWKAPSWRSSADKDGVIWFDVPNRMSLEVLFTSGRLFASLFGGKFWPSADEWWKVSQKQCGHGCVQIFTTHHQPSPGLARDCTLLWVNGARWPLAVTLPSCQGTYSRQISERTVKIEPAKPDESWVLVFRRRHSPRKPNPSHDAAGIYWHVGRCLSSTCFCILCGVVTQMLL